MDRLLAEGSKHMTYADLCLLWGINENHFELFGDQGISESYRPTVAASDVETNYLQPSWGFGRHRLSQQGPVSSSCKRLVQCKPPASGFNWFSRYPSQG